MDDLVYGLIYYKVYGKPYACANIRYQAAFPPPPSRPGYEARVGIVDAHGKGTNIVVL